MEEQLERLLVESPVGFYWRFYLHLLDNWRQFKQLKNCPRHTHRTPNTCKISLKFFETIRVETCHFCYHTSISSNKKITIKSNFLGKTLFRACLINGKDLSLYFRVGFQICFYSYFKVSSPYLLVFVSYF